MRLIDADELKKNFQDELCKGIACAECSMQTEGFCRVERWIDIAPTVEAVPEEQYQRMVRTAASLTEVVGEMIDTEPTKHGKWIDFGKRKVNAVVTVLKCSECGSVLYWRGNYCPHCGAKMDEVEE